MSRTWDYDARGNRAQASGSSDPTVPTSVAQFGSNNRITLANVTYDAAGNMTQSAAGTMGYDAENRLVSASGAAYEYDGLGRRGKRVLRGVTTVWVYDAAGQAIAEHGSAGTASSQKQWVTVDALGSGRAVSDSLGALAGCHDYWPFGEEMGTSVNARPACYASVDGLKQKFTGKERDGETGLDYLKGEPDLPGFGRFESGYTHQLCISDRGHQLRRSFLTALRRRRSKPRRAGPVNPSSSRNRSKLS